MNEGFEITGYTQNGVRKNIHIGIETIKELRRLWELHERMLLNDLLHEDIIRIEARYHDKNGQALNITELLKNAD